MLVRASAFIVANINRWSVLGTQLGTVHTFGLADINKVGSKNWNITSWKRDYSTRWDGSTPIVYRRRPMVYLPKSVVSWEQAAPKRKMATRWKISATAAGIRSDEMFSDEALFCRLNLLECKLFFQRKTSTMIIYKKKTNQRNKWVDWEKECGDICRLVADGLDRSIERTVVVKEANGQKHQTALARQ